MPKVLKLGRYRFHFFRNERNEPPHIHVKAAEDQAKFWLDPVELESSYGFNTQELNEIERIIVEDREEWTKAWYEYFQDKI